MTEYDYLLRNLTEKNERLIYCFPDEIKSKPYYVSQSGYVDLNKLPDEFKTEEVYIAFLNRFSNHFFNVPIEFRTKQWYEKLLQINITFLVETTNCFHVFKYVVPQEYVTFENICALLVYDCKYFCNTRIACILRNNTKLIFPNDLIEMCSNYYIKIIQLHNLNDSCMIEEFNKIIQSMDNLVKYLNVDPREYVSHCLAHGANFSLMPQNLLSCQEITEIYDSIFQTKKFRPGIFMHLPDFYKLQLNTIENIDGYSYSLLTPTKKTKDLTLAILKSSQLYHLIYNEIQFDLKDDPEICEIIINKYVDDINNKKIKNIMYIHNKFSTNKLILDAIKSSDFQKQKTLEFGWCD